MMLALVDACGGTSDATDDSTPVVETIAEQKGDQLMVGYSRLDITRPEGSFFKIWILPSFGAWNGGIEQL